MNENADHPLRETLLFALGFALILLVPVASLYIGLKKQDRAAARALAGLQDAAEQKFALLPDLLKTVRRLDKSESWNAWDADALLAAYRGAPAGNGKVSAIMDVDSKFARLLDEAGEVPALRTDSEFKGLMSRLSQAQESFEKAQLDYNEQAIKLNDMARSGRYRGIAIVFGFRDRAIARGLPFQPYGSSTPEAPQEGQPALSQ